MSDTDIVGWIARQWPLDYGECCAAVDAAHILHRREHLAIDSRTR
jgi:hypothetical protein